MTIQLKHLEFHSQHVLIWLSYPSLDYKWQAIPVKTVFTGAYWSVVGWAGSGWYRSNVLEPFSRHGALWNKALGSLHKISPIHFSNSRVCAQYTSPVLQYITSHKSCSGFSQHIFLCIFITGFVLYSPWWLKQCVKRHETNPNCNARKLIFLSDLFQITYTNIATARQNRTRFQIYVFVATVEYWIGIV